MPLPWSGTPTAFSYNLPREVIASMERALEIIEAYNPKVA